VPWLEPDINDAMAELPARGRKAVLIVPLGFVSDHMEVLWDLDTEAMETADELGLTAIRTRLRGRTRRTSRDWSTSWSSG
jgi:ferrochelatase